MTRTRLAIVGTLAVAGTTVVQMCGGKITNGYFDSDGGFHAPDGAFLYGPGSSCKDYDASGLVGTEKQWGGPAFTSIPCDRDAGVVTGAAYCAAALPVGLSAPFPGIGVVGDYKLDTTSCQGTCEAYPENVYPCPSADETGNFVCRQFFQQFVAASGAQARASCVPCTWQVVGANGICTGDYVCVPDCCAVGGFCVQRGADASCEYPCQP